MLIPGPIVLAFMSIVCCLFVKVKDANKISGKERVICPLYDEIDAILGNRAASSPPIVIESGEGQEDDDASPSVEGNSS